MGELQRASGFNYLETTTDFKTGVVLES